MMITAIILDFASPHIKLEGDFLCIWTEEGLIKLFRKKISFSHFYLFLTIPQTNVPGLLHEGMVSQINDLISMG